MKDLLSKGYYYYYHSQKVPPICPCIINEKYPQYGFPPFLQENLDIIFQQSQPRINKEGICGGM